MTKQEKEINDAELEMLAETMTVEELKSNALKYMTALMTKITHMSESYNIANKQTVLNIIATIHVASQHLNNATKKFTNMEK